jgi:hypothetical protein
MRLLQDWNDRAGPEYDEDSGLVQEDEWQSCEGSVYGLFLIPHSSTTVFMAFCAPPLSIWVVACWIVLRWPFALGNTMDDGAFSRVHLMPARSDPAVAQYDLCGLCPGGYEPFCALHQYHRSEETTPFQVEVPWNRWSIKKHDSVVFVLPR